MRAQPTDSEEGGRLLGNGQFSKSLRALRSLHPGCVPEPSCRGAFKTQMLRAPPRPMKLEPLQVQPGYHIVFKASLPSRM